MANNEVMPGGAEHDRNGYAAWVSDALRGRDPGLATIRELVGAIGELVTDPEAIAACAELDLPTAGIRADYEGILQRLHEICASTAQELNASVFNVNLFDTVYVTTASGRELVQRVVAEGDRILGVGTEGPIYEPYLAVDVIHDGMRWYRFHTFELTPDALAEQNTAMPRVDGA